MRQRLRAVFQNNPLLEVASQNSGGILVKLFTGLATSKIIAIFVGPSGMAWLGNLSNFQNVINNFSTAGLEKGAIRYCAEYKDDEQRLNSFVSTLFFIGISICLLLGILLFFGSEFLNKLIFPTKNFQFVFELLAFLLPLGMLNVYCLAILKGIGEFKKVILINIFSNLLNLALIALFVSQNGLDGAMLAYIILPSAILFVTLLVANKKLHLVGNFRLRNISKLFGKNLSQYALMTLVSSITFPVVFLMVRNFIIDRIGIEEAGFWEALVRISNYYLLFIMSLLSLYILPKMAETDSDSGFRKIVFDFYKSILPIFGIGLILVYFLRVWIVKIIFSDEFLPMTELFLWQLIGDFVRVAVIVITFQLHAKKMVWKFILSDLFLAAITYLSSVFLISKIGLEGVVVGYAITWTLYGIVILYIFRKVFFHKWFL
ncbi:MAG TPA: O-antigen translocase [Flavobacteriaceae bacterium]|nr:O-antigen translocase [Flavobacteriaceae bacterium]